jgi:hypothetical protein
MKRLFCLVLGHKWFKNAKFWNRDVFVCDRCGKHKTTWMNEENWGEGYGPDNPGENPWD